MTEPVSMLLSEASWPASDLGKAMCSLARRARLVTEAPDLVGPATSLNEDIETWMLDTGARLGVEIVPVSSTGVELPDMLRRLGPSLLRLPGAFADRYLVVLRGGSFGLTVLTPAL